MNFDRIAPHYRWLETIAFGRTLQSARACWITQIPRPHRALIVGEGNGLFLCELLRVHPRIEVDCVDASQGMLDLAGARVCRLCPESLAAIRFHHRNFLDWSPTGTYDLLVTHFFLDCFENAELDLVMSKLAAVASHRAIWLIADFARPTDLFARAHAAIWLRTMYTFFGVIAQLKTRRLVDPADYLKSAGFWRISRKLFRFKMLRSDFYARPPRL